MKRRRIARCAGVTAAAAGLAFGFTGQATAASQFALTYTNSNMCVGGESITNADAFSSGYTYGYKRNSNGTCTLVNRPTGVLSVEKHLLAYDAPGNVWFTCATEGPARNGGSAFRVGIESHYRCGGNLWHATFTAAYGWDGSAWRGAWVGSNNEWVPALNLSTAPSSPPAAPKTNAADAIKRGEVRLGSPGGPKTTAAQLQKPPTVRGDAPVENPPSGGTYTVRTLTR
ncbi:MULTISPECIES: hypothetical protein [unclassified Embleya]|uniref:hypothetical protein n=1 Tax=unclassified Embleya TaxID=2699296 RepID=UPI0033F1A33F